MATYLLEATEQQALDTLARFQHVKRICADGTVVSAYRLGIPDGPSAGYTVLALKGGRQVAYTAPLSTPREALTRLDQIASEHAR